MSTLDWLVLCCSAYNTRATGWRSLQCYGDTCEFLQWRNTLFRFRDGIESIMPCAFVWKNTGDMKMMVCWWWHFFFFLKFTLIYQWFRVILSFYYHSKFNFYFFYCYFFLLDSFIEFILFFQFHSSILIFKLSSHFFL